MDYSGQKKIRAEPLNLHPAFGIVSKEVHDYDVDLLNLFPVLFEQGLKEPVKARFGPGCDVTDC